MTAPPGDTDAPHPDNLRLRALLDARTAALARRGRDAAEAVATSPFLVCTCGDDRYGLPLHAVAQVVPARACTPVPGAPPELLGLVALSGRVVSVLGLAQVLGRPPQAKAGAGHFLVLRGGSAPLALAVDRVAGVVAAEASVGEAREAGGLEPAPFAGLGADAVSSYAPATGRDAVGADAGFVVIDLPRLLRRYLPQG